MHKGWVVTKGTVERVDEYPTPEGTQYSIVFSYEVDGKSYSGTYESIRSQDRDDVISVLYDPNNPESNNLVQMANAIERIRVWGLRLVVAFVAAAVLLFLYLYGVRR